MKQCTICFSWKPEEDFPKRSGKFGPHCRSCYNEAQYRSKAKRADYYRGLTRKAVRKFKLRTKYGLTLDQYERILQGQGGCCKICGGDGRGRTLHVDHDHKTGQVRGILCNGCNILVGRLEHPLAERAKEYLAKAKAGEEVMK